MCSHILEFLLLMSYYILMRCIVCFFCLIQLQYVLSFSMGLLESFTHKKKYIKLLTPSIFSVTMTND